MVSAISCAPDGTCAAGGRYLDASLAAHAFVLTERNGTWGKAIQVPGLAALHSKNASVTAMSCATGGCVAGGYYQSAPSHYNAFVISEKNGRWSRFTTVLRAAKTATAITAVRSLSCSGPESCAASGQPAFVVSEVHGRWGQPRTFPTKDKHGRVEVSCVSAGNCTAGWGTFADTERNGRWLKAVTVPGLAAGTSHAAPGRGITSISCISAGNCLVGGLYPSSHHDSAFVASERGGRWGQAMEIPGYRALNQTTSDGELAAVSCLSAGNCVAGGSYTERADFEGGVYEPFVASERHGHWGRAIEVPGIPPAGSTTCEPDSDSCVAGQVLSASCAPGGTCAAGGWYDTPAISGSAAFVTLYKNGRWTKVTQIPGLKALDTANASVVNSVSCTSAGTCAAGGSYSTIQQRVGPAFVADEKNGVWSQAHTVAFGG